MNKQEIFEFCEKLLKKDNLDFKYVEQSVESIDLNKFEIEKYEMHKSQGLFVRAIVKNKIGSYLVQDVRKEKILDGIKKAKAIGNIKKSDVKYSEFGSGKNNRKIKTHKGIDDLPFLSIIDDIKKNITKEKHVTGYVGGASKVKHTSFYLNKNTNKFFEKSYLSLYTEVLTKNKKRGAGSYSNVFTEKNKIDINLNFKNAKENAELLIDPCNGNKGVYDLILTPEVTKSLIGYILSATTAQTIEEKRSFLHNKINKNVFSEKLTLKEKPYENYFLSSQAIDDEGVSTKEKFIFDKGVFKKPIYDLYNALKYEKSPSGNGFFSNNYSAKYTNVILDKGNLNIKNIISKTKKGIMVFQLLGFHTNKINTSEFSLTLALGKEIENGCYKNSVTNLNFTGDFLSVLKDIYFSKEQMFFGSSLYGYMVIPNVKLI